MKHSQAIRQMLGLSRLWALILLLGTVLPAAACNRASCDGLHAPTLSASAPRLTYVEMLESQEDNPWGLVFALSFTSATGQVGQGNVLVYTGANEPAVLPLQDAFSSSSLSLSATTGRIAVPLTLSQGGVQDDTTVRLGFQVQDANEQYSNCYSLDIHIDIGLNTTGSRHVKTKTLYAGACPAWRSFDRPMAQISRLGGLL